MDKLDFRISAEAVQYLRTHLLTGHGEPMVLAIAPTTHPRTMDFDPKKIETSEQELGALAKRQLNSLPSEVELRWSIGATRKSRLPDKDMFIIDGIECFFPQEVQSALKGRVLRVENGQLVFDPGLEPPAKLYLSRA